ncbi:MAG: 30S ribosomal protein S16 [bacterium]
MLKIRLTRVGKRNRPQFRVVVAEHTSPIRGKFIEVLGSKDPSTKTIILNEERIKYWLGTGAQTSATVHNLLIDKGVIKGEKLKSWSKKEKTEEEKASK